MRNRLSLALLRILILISSLQAQLRMKRICFLQTGPDDELTNLICYDSNHNGLNELIFEKVLWTYVSAWMVWEYRPINRYELVFADTGAYPLPPGITTGNFRPYDVGDIDRDNLTDLLGPNEDKPQNPDTFYNVVTTQESPNYNSYPETLSWWYRFDHNAAASQPFYFPPDLDSDSINEILITAPSPLGIAIFENIANNQNVVVWNRIEDIAAWSFTFGDFDLDNRKEFVTAWLGSLGRVFIFENIGDNQYELVRVDTVRLPNGSDVFSGNDLDGDGKPEFLVAFYSYPRATYYLYMWEATGNNTYQRTLIDQIQDVEDWGRRSKCGDLDGDGVEEIVWSRGNGLIVYKATGNNQFQPVWLWTQDHGGACLITNIYDMNQNGYNEIVVGGSGKTSIFEVEAIRVRRPNGGENFIGNTQELIRWQKFYPPRCDSLSLFYSLDNGRTYDTIITGLSGNDTSYLWTVPDTSADSCKVKIIAYGPGWQFDESDGVFAITPSGIEEDRYPLTANRLLLKILPNPAKAGIKFQIQGAEGKDLILKIYNLAGELVKSFSLTTKNQPPITLTWDGTDNFGKRLPPGVYCYRLKTADGFIETKEFILLK